MAKKKSVRRSSAKRAQENTWPEAGENEMPPTPPHPQKPPTPQPPPAQERSQEESSSQPEQPRQQANANPIDFDQAMSAIEAAIPSLYTTMELIRALGHSLAPQSPQ